VAQLATLGRDAMSQRNNIIACSVIIAISILIGLYGWGLIKSHIYIAVVMSITLFIAGFYMLYAVFSSLRRGVILFNAKGSISAYERRTSPLGFWFYVCLLGVVGLIVCSVGIYILFHIHDFISD
jgi:hypothetical protein